MNKLEYASENHHKFNPKGDKIKYRHKEKVTGLSMTKSTECGEHIIYSLDFSSNYSNKETADGSPVILGDNGITCPKCLEIMK